MNVIQSILHDVRCDAGKDRDDAEFGFDEMMSRRPSSTEFCCFWRGLSENKSRGRNAAMPRQHGMFWPPIRVRVRSGTIPKIYTRDASPTEAPLVGGTGFGSL